MENYEYCIGCETGCDADSPHRLGDGYHPECLTRAAERERRMEEAREIEEALAEEARDEWWETREDLSADLSARIDSVLPTTGYSAKELEPCPGYDDDSEGRPKWWTRKNDKEKKLNLDFALWEYFNVPEALWKTI